MPKVLKRLPGIGRGIFHLKYGASGIKYVPADINESFNKILIYIVERQKFG